MNDKVKKIAAVSGSSPPQTCSASPPSTSSSPSHEFSFTISLNQQSNIDKFTVDLTPADDIFFHGHLLPLQLISNLPVSPRSSTNSLDSFTLPIHELFQQQNIPNANTSDSADTQTPDQNNPKGRIKSKSFSLFGLAKWRKGCEERGKEEGEKQKKKLKSDISHVIKRYMRMVRPLLAFRKGRSNLDFYNDSHSFSGSLVGSRKVKRGLRGRRGEFSAPASMRTSPTNSGLLVATVNIPSYTSESTMEELQAAIQAAITHCKNSSAKEEDKDNNHMPSLGSEVNLNNQFENSLHLDHAQASIV